MSPPATITVGPSPLKVLTSVAIASVAITAGATILVAFLEFLAAEGLLGLLPVPLWLWSHRWTIVICLAVLLACYCGIVLLGTAVWARPRVEIGPDGFVEYGVAGRRSRRWCEISGGFRIIRVGWPAGIVRRPVVAYQLTEAFKGSARFKPIASLAGNDEAILIAPELAIGASELADLLNRWAHGVPNGTPPASIGPPTPSGSENQGGPEPPVSNLN